MHSNNQQVCGERCAMCFWLAVIWGGGALGCVGAPALCGHTTVLGSTEVGYVAFVAGYGSMFLGHHNFMKEWDRLSARGESLCPCSDDSLTPEDRESQNCLIQIFRRCCFFCFQNSTLSAPHIGLSARYGTFLMPTSRVLVQAPGMPAPQTLMGVTSETSRGIAYSNSRESLPSAADGQEICTICTGGLPAVEEEVLRQNQVRELGCRHSFHNKCIERWMRTQSQELIQMGKEVILTCPTCRAVIANF